MPSDRTFVTELATGLGMFGDDDLDTVMARRPPGFVSLTSGDWDRLSDLWSGHQYGAEFVGGFLNGRAFLAAAAALNGRLPRIVEWTGGRRSPGDEVVPSDLRIDHVYLVSCKYLSGILHNPSPARLIDGLLSQAPVDDARDWYERVAPLEYQRLYEICAEDDSALPDLATEMSTAQRRGVAVRLRSGWPSGGVEAYERLCHTVSQATADAWTAAIGSANAESAMWRLLRIGSAPYFVLGSNPSGAMRLRVDTPWDWRQAYRFRRLQVEPQEGGQPRVGWSVAYEDKRTNDQRVVRGHVEIRWSHGRFAQPSRSVRPAAGGEGLPGLAPRGLAGYHGL